ncbi:Nramp family divalent metal transporter [Mediterraneibacter gnavus]|uniref:Nramp family divalent metal transporter n=1 Tax=Mediterraneibacter gnavus TaxID=33038 RepID=UPI0036D22B43
MIATGIVIGPGAITTAAMLGSNFGYTLIWLIIPIVFMGITFMMVTNRLAIVTGMPTIHAIRKYYGPVAAGFVGIALFMACLFFTMGNISGTGAGVNLITGLNWKVGSALMIAVVIYCYFTKNVYSKVEKIITACILGMIVAFYATLIGVGGPDWGETGKAFVSFQIPAGGLATALAFISTNAAVTTGIYSTYLGKEKKWKKEDLFNGVMLTDAVIHIISVVLITGSIILVGAIYCILQDRKLQRLLNWRKCWFRSWEMQRSILWEWRC